MVKPWGLFRYRKCDEHLWQDLANSRLYFSVPAALNDPFDCRIDWRNALQRAKDSPLISAKQRLRLERIEAAFEEPWETPKAADRNDGGADGIRNTLRRKSAAIH